MHQRTAGPSNEQIGGAIQALDPGAAPGLQKNIKPALQSPDVSVWMDRLEAVRRQVCRIEIPGQALGTGFLVGAVRQLFNYPNRPPQGTLEVWLDLSR